MGFIKGAREFKAHRRGESLTRKQTMLAKCYVCNGEEESQEDCRVPSCPLYQYHHHRDPNRELDA